MNNKKHRVLFINDDLLVIRAYSRVLKNEDYILETATTGAEAVDIIKEKPVSVVVSDEVLCDFDGSLILEFVLQNYPRTQRIIFTGWPECTLNRDRIKACKPYAVLNKPDTENRLIGVIRSAIKDFEKSDGVTN